MFWASQQNQADTRVLEPSQWAAQPPGAARKVAMPSGIKGLRLPFLLHRRRRQKGTAGNRVRNRRRRRYGTVSETYSGSYSGRGADQSTRLHLSVSLLAAAFKRGSNRTPTARVSSPSVPAQRSRVVASVHLQSAH